MPLDHKILRTVGLKAQALRNVNGIVDDFGAQERPQRHILSPGDACRYAEISWHTTVLILGKIYYDWQTDCGKLYMNTERAVAKTTTCLSE